MIKWKITEKKVIGFFKEINYNENVSRSIGRA